MGSDRVPTVDGGVCSIGEKGGGGGVRTRFIKKSRGESSVEDSMTLSAKREEDKGGW